MKIPLNSLRWRLHVWFGLILFTVLLAFGVTTYLVARGVRTRITDGELERQGMLVVETILPDALRDSFRDELRSKMRELAGPDGTPPAMRPMPTLDEGPPGTSTDLNPYYAVWAADNTLLYHSKNLPEPLPRPAVRAAGPYRRQRGELRELAIVSPGGLRIVVGRSVVGDRRELTRFAWGIGLGGAAILVIGLAGGWWFAAGAIRPIKAISATAEKIASGNLSERIDMADTDTELGQLAGVLNTTFERLEAAFSRQAQFTADASHELRTPVTVVLTQAQAALARERPPAEYREALAACQRAAMRMRRLIESLLTLARSDAPNARAAHERCDLAEIAREGVDLLRPLARERQIRIETELAPASCLGDAGQLAQVVNNLVGNAISHHRAPGLVKLSVRAMAGHCELAVADDGPGIAAEDLPHIFERFYRVDAARSQARGETHSGLGLAITRAIVIAHGGVVEVASEPGRGSVFTVRLPAGAA